LGEGGREGGRGASFSGKVSDFLPSLIWFQLALLSSFWDNGIIACKKEDSILVRRLGQKQKKYKGKKILKVNHQSM
jgi:hypothetical protein